MAGVKISAALNRMAALSLAIFVAAAAYWYTTSPPNAVSELVAAARNGNDDEFANLIDLKSVRDSLRVQIALKATYDEASPWAALERNVVSVLRDPLIDAAVTPATLAMLVSQLDGDRDNGGNTAPDWTVQREGLNSFVVHKGQDNNDWKLAFRFRREGLRWILSEQVLPQNETEASPRDQ